MAINPSTNPTMSGRVTAADAAFPYGSSKDETSPGAGDGTPYFKARADDIFGFQQALLSALGIVPSGTADQKGASQYLQSIIALASGLGEWRIDSGAANAYVLDEVTDGQPIAALRTGMRVSFVPDFTNTGASTANIDGLGVVSIKQSDGTTDPIAGMIPAGQILTLVYDGTNLLLPDFISSTLTALQTLAGGLTVNGPFTSPGINDDTTSNRVGITDTLLQLYMNAGAVSHEFSFDENGGQMILKDNTATNALLQDVSFGDSRMIHVLPTGDLLLGIGGTNTTGGISLRANLFAELANLRANGQMALIGAGTAPIPALVIANNSTTGWYAPLANEVALAINGAEANRTDSNGYFSFDRKRASVTRTTDQAIPTSSVTVINWNSEAYDTSAIHDNVTNNTRLTVPAGATLVRLTAYIFWEGAGSTGGTNDQFEATITKNVGATIMAAQSAIEPGTVEEHHLSIVTEPLEVVGGDYFEVYAYQESGANRDVKSTSKFALEVIK